MTSYPNLMEKACVLTQMPVHIVTCQAHPALVKRVQWSVRVFQFLVVYH